MDELYLDRFDNDPDAIDDAADGVLLGGDWRSLRRGDMAHNPCGAAPLSALAGLPALEDAGLPPTSTGDHVTALWIRRSRAA